MLSILNRTRPTEQAAPASLGPLQHRRDPFHHLQGAKAQCGLETSAVQVGAVIQERVGATGRIVTQLREQCERAVSSHRSVMFILLLQGEILLKLADIKAVAPMALVRS